MAISRKRLWDRTPTVVKSALAPFLRAVPSEWFLGRRFRDEVAFLREAETWDHPACGEFQRKRLRDVCIFAAEKAPFYELAFREAGLDPATVTPDSLQRLPTIDKENVLSNLAGMMTVEPREADHVTTGGSSGRPLAFYADRKRSSIEYAYLTETWRRCGFAVGTPMAVLRGRIVRPDRSGLRHDYDPILRHHYYSNFHTSDDSLGGYLRHIRQIGPCFLHAYPSSAEALASYVVRNPSDRPTNIMGVILESENIYPSQRDLIEGAFGVRAFGCYGHSEKLVLAGECEKSRHYHVWPTYGFFELLDDSGCRVTTAGMRGEITGTGFLNRATVMIRYRTGDYATYVSDSCEACGRAHTVITDIEGRWPAGTLYTSEGGAITMTALNLHDRTFEKIRRFQFQQETPGRALLCLMPATALFPADIEIIRAAVESKLQGQLRLDIKVVDDIPLTARGKHNYVVQRIIGRPSSRVRCE